MQQDLEKPTFTIQGIEVENFKEYARVQGMTIQDWLDDLRQKGVIDVSRQTFSNWESGRHMPSAHKLAALAKYLDEDIAELYKYFNIALQERNKNE